MPPTPLLGCLPKLQAPCPGRWGPQACTALPRPRADELNASPPHSPPLSGRFHLQAPASPCPSGDPLQPSAARPLCTLGLPARDQGPGWKQMPKRSWGCTWGTWLAALPPQLGTLTLSCGGRRSELLGARCLSMESGRGLTGTHWLTQGFVSNRARLPTRQDCGQMAQQQPHKQAMGLNPVTQAWVHMLL